VRLLRFRSNNEFCVVIPVRVEWCCKGCGVQNEMADRRCWNCDYTIDGEPPPSAGDDEDSPSIHPIGAETVG
jgi:hypothetical protein